MNNAKNVIKVIANFKFIVLVLNNSNNERENNNRIRTLSSPK